MTEEQDKMYQCDECRKIVYLMEAGRGDQLKCCDQLMREMSDQEKEPYHPRFPRPGAP